MARKETITKQDILNGAFELVAVQGIQDLTARKLASYIGCSTQPIFRVYKNMAEVQEEVFRLSVMYYAEYYKAYPKSCDIPFVDLGLAYIQFAKDNKSLFRLLFLSDERYGMGFYEILNGNEQFVMAQINAASSYGCHDPQGLFMKMWIFIHGAASMSLTDDYDLDENQTRELLIGAYQSFLKV